MHKNDVSLKRDRKPGVSSYTTKDLHNITNNISHMDKKTTADFDAAW